MIKISFSIEEKKCIALDNNIEVGECSFAEIDNTWNINHTYVKEEYQGQGIARKLVECVKEQADYYHKNLIADCSYADKVLSRR